MNKIIMAVLILLLASCTSRTSDKQKTITDSAVVEEKSTHDAAHETNEQELKLNEGKKWKLDDITRTNIAAIRKILDDKAGGDPKLLAAAVRQGTDKLVKECRMKGADHDALHLWLEGFLKDLGDLESSTAGQPAANTGKLKADIEKFYQYFE